ncbi:MAG: hypothetical protein GC161_16695 [Planctomycetaceae bacterium]|nr:hypothetical protein [Planctomycetaceae bacterium]
MAPWKASALAVLLLALAVQPGSARQCSSPWSTELAVGEVLTVPGIPFPLTTIPIGICATRWDHDQNPSTPDRLVVGGSFASLGGTAIANLAVQNGAGGWTAVGGGRPFAVYAVEAGADGRLYAAGISTNFATFQSVPAISRFDGNQWQNFLAPPPYTVPTSFVATVDDFLVDADGTFIVAGNFTSIGGVNAQSIARWNGSNWTALGTGLTGGVRRIERLPNGQLLAAVAFPSGGAAGTSSFATWNGTTWTAAFVGASAQCFGVTDFEFSPSGQLVASGAFAYPSTQVVDQVARWTGQDWQPLGVGFNTEPEGNGVTGLVLLPDGDWVALGRFQLNGNSDVMRAARFNGTSWSVFDQGLAPDVPDELQTLDGAALPDGQLVAVGILSDEITSPTSISAAIVGLRQAGCPGAATLFGTSGAGVSGPLNLAVAEPAWIGGNFALTGSGFSNTSLAVSLIGFSPSTLPLAAVFAGADPSSLLSVDLTNALLAVAPITAGEVPLTINLPDLPSLVGLTLYTQLGEIALAPGIGVVAFATTNAAQVTIGAL